jgi:hypothetical protein
VALDAVGLVELEAVFALLMRWETIVIATVVALPLLWAWR